MTRRRLPAPERWLRVAIYFAAMLAVSMWTEIIGHVWGMWPTRRGSRERVLRCNFAMKQWGMVLTKLTFSVLKSRLDVVGRVPLDMRPGRFIIVSNHQSTADIAILIWALSDLELRYVAKEELGHGLPAVSMALRHFGSA